MNQCCMHMQYVCAYAVFVRYLRMRYTHVYGWLYVQACINIHICMLPAYVVYDLAHIWIDGFVYIYIYIRESIYVYMYMSEHLTNACMHMPISMLIKRRICLYAWRAYRGCTCYTPGWLWRFGWAHACKTGLEEEAETKKFNKGQRHRQTNSQKTKHGNNDGKMNQVEREQTWGQK